MNKQMISVLEWLTGGVVVVLAILAWYFSYISGGEPTAYDIFPAFGLIAFSLMWTHFVFGAIRKHFNITETRSAYMNTSMSLVLALIILHPSVLWYNLYRDGLGLPPLSAYQAYPSEILALTLGSLGLAIFLLFEFKRKFANSQWWKYTEQVQIVGIFAIFIHSLTLGSAVGLGWFRVVWIMYGATLVLAYTYSRLHEYKIKGVENADKS